MPSPWSEFGALLDVNLSRQRMEAAQSAYQVAQDDSTVQIRELGQVGLSDLPGIIRGSGGVFVTSAGDPLVQSARGEWWKFSVEISTDGNTARITENNYLLYGGIGVVGIVLLIVLARR